MNLQRHRQDWEDLGRVDPLWAIHTDPSRRYGKWDLAEFYATGERDVAEVMATAHRLGLPAARGSALDFGCGVGRLTRALAGHFRESVGVDISAAMIEQARELNRDVPGCRFVLNTEDRLPTFADETFDLVYTKWVLQHLPSRSLFEGYLRELVRVLRRDGLLVLQVRTGLTLKARLQLGRRLYAALRVVGLGEDLLYHRLGLNPIRMMVVREEDVTDLLAAQGARVVEVERYRVRSGSGSVLFVTR